MKELEGQTVSHYRITEKIGQGGMGIVYKATDTRLQRTVALKFLPSYLTPDNESLNRFIQEARTASALDHPNICTIHEIGTSDDSTFICMGYYEGESLKEIISKGPLSIERSVEIGIQIARGLVKAHEKGIVHRDIKPSNIIVTDEGVVKTLDFGIAKTSDIHLTVTGNNLGTTAYMSPEQCSGRPVNQNTDVWSLGVVCYQMLTGNLPFPGSHDQAIIYSILNTEPVPLQEIRPDIPDDLTHMVNRAMAKDPLDRYPTMDELLGDLELFQQGQQIKSKKSSGVVHRPKWLYPVLMVICGLLVVWAYINYRGANASHIDSIAVLPFQIETADSNYQYLADGIAERIIYGLSPMPEMKVIASSTSFRLRNDSLDPHDIAQKLNVQAVLLGKVKVEDQNFIISAELINGIDNSIIWGKQYIRQRAELLALQEQIIEEVADHIDPDWKPNENTLRSRQITLDNEAYLKYLQGRYFWNYRRSTGFAKALELFNQAIAIDSSFALAYTGLADTYNLMGSYNIIPMVESHPMAHDMALKALELDENLAEAHASLGAILADYYWDWPKVSYHFKRAIVLNPNYATARHWYAGYLADLGQFDEALLNARKARSLDPLSYSVNLIVGMTLFKARRYQDAIEELEKLKSMYPNVAPTYIGLGLAHIHSGEMLKGISILERGRTLNPDFVDIIGVLGFAYGKAGKVDSALEILKELEDLSKSKNVASVSMATIYLGLRDNDQAIYWLQKMVEERHWMSRWLNVNPAYDQVRDDPRFQALVEKVGMESL